MHQRTLTELKRRKSHTAEDIALQLLALRAETPSPEKLLQLQLKSGGWSNDAATNLPNVFVTCLSLIALAAHRTVAEPASDRAFAWLSSVRGLESHWLWQWKFRLFDRQVQFDYTKSGWPWISGTVSWVPPTAAAILAHQIWRRESERILSATEMLLDRACPRGGWNAGNSVVFGVELDPHPDFTAFALLALRRKTDTNSLVVQRSLGYLMSRLISSKSAYSLAWGVLALSIYSHPRSEQLRDRLETTAASQLREISTRNLALAAIALEGSRNIFLEVVK